MIEERILLQGRLAEWLLRLTANQVVGESWRAGSKPAPSSTAQPFLHSHAHSHTEIYHIWLQCEREGEKRGIWLRQIAGVRLDEGPVLKTGSS